MHNYRYYQFISVKNCHYIGLMEKHYKNHFICGFRSGGVYGCCSHVICRNYTNNLDGLDDLARIDLYNRKNNKYIYYQFHICKISFDVNDTINVGVQHKSLHINHDIWVGNEFIKLIESLDVRTKNISNFPKK